MTALSIDENSGEVTLISDPDYEAQAQYSFTVIATDAAGNANEGQLVTLDINDLDDAAPEITSSTTAAVDETVPSGQVVYTAVSDDDAAIYSLKAESDSALTIDGNSGAVSLNEDPVYLSQSQYSFTVIATDAVGNASEQAVTLSVNNIDEVAPTFVSLQDVSVLENIGANKAVYQAVVDDSGDISGDITFSLVTSDPLTINQDTGVVTLLTNPDTETTPVYNFTVIANDAAGNSVEQDVILTVGDIDDEAPVFSGGNTAVINENIGVGEVIFTAVAQDKSVVNYELGG